MKPIFDPEFLPCSFGYLPLPPKAVAVLAALVAQAGQVVTKEALFAAAWPDTAVTDGVLKGCIRQISRALGERGKTAQYIATVSWKRSPSMAATPMLQPSRAIMTITAPRLKSARLNISITQSSRIIEV